METFLGGHGVTEMVDGHRGRLGAQSNTDAETFQSFVHMTERVSYTLLGCSSL